MKVVQFVNCNYVIVLPYLTSQAFLMPAPGLALVLSITCRLPPDCSELTSLVSLPRSPISRASDASKMPKVYFCLIFLPQQIKEFLWTVNCGSPKSGQNTTRAAPGRQGTGSSIQPPIMTMLIAAHADFLPFLMMFWIFRYHCLGAS